MRGLQRADGPGPDPGDLQNGGRAPQRCLTPLTHAARAAAARGKANRKAVCRSCPTPNKPGHSGPKARPRGTRRTKAETPPAPRSLPRCTRPWKETQK